MDSAGQDCEPSLWTHLLVSTLKGNFYVSLASKKQIDEGFFCGKILNWPAEPEASQEVHFNVSSFVFSWFTFPWPLYKTLDDLGKTEKFVGIQKQT